MITNVRDITDELTLTAARTLLGAVKTAPHAKGVDILEAAVISGDELAALVTHMKAMGQAPGRAFFIRDASNIEQSPCVMLVGTHLKTKDLIVNTAVLQLVARSLIYTLALLMLLM